MADREWPARAGWNHNRSADHADPGIRHPCACVPLDGDRSCLHITTPSRGCIDFTAAAGSGQCAGIAPQARGFITFDPQTLAITHLQRTVPLALAERTHFAPFASVDYSPFHKEDDTRSYQLPSHIVATQTRHGIILTFDAHYINCHEFHTSVILRDAQGNPLSESVETSIAGGVTWAKVECPAGTAG